MYINQQQKSLYIKKNPQCLWNICFQLMWQMYSGMDVFFTIQSILMDKIRPHPFFSCWISYLTVKWSANCFKLTLMPSHEFVSDQTDWEYNMRRGHRDAQTQLHEEMKMHFEYYCTLMPVSWQLYCTCFQFLIHAQSFREAPHCHVWIVDIDIVYLYF